MIIDKTNALMSLVPNAQWSVIDNKVYWLDTEQAQPTDAELEAEVARLQADYEAKQYQRQRAKEYPPITDYLDGVVKGDQAQIDAYIAACQAVKAKYPKV